MDQHAHRLIRTPQVPLHELQQALAGLAVPKEGAPKSAWQNLEKELQAVMIAHRDIGHEWVLDEKSVRRLSRYLQANQLHLDCLQVAYVSDREAIADSLLLVP